MDLWIRSQDRSYLMPTKDIISEFGGSLFYQGLILGQYKTKERALEVLDEIQNILKPQRIIKNIDTSVEIANLVHIVNPTYETVQQLSTYVYEMPKE